MNDIEKEIEELEELIRLQRLKCDLLHRKNRTIIANADTTSAPDTRKKSGTLETTTDEKDDVTMNILHRQSDNRRSSDQGIKFRLTENVRHMIMSTTDFKEGEGNGEKTNVLQASGDGQTGSDKQGSKQEGKLIASDPPAPVIETKEDRFVNAITRLSRLNTDLANERNLLAWGRTALASARTFLAFIGVTAVTDFGKASRQVCYLGFGVMSIYIILQGAERYNKIKKIVYLKDPPRHFERLTNAPLPICLSLLFALGLMSVCFDQWED